MSDRTCSPGPTPNTVRSADGMVLPVPEGWVLLPPGDAALTRRVKAAGESKGALTALAFLFFFQHDGNPTLATESRRAAQAEKRTYPPLFGQVLL